MPHPTSWYEGGAPTDGAVGHDRIFIYHVPKTGTTTLFQAIRSSALHHFSLLERQGKGIVAPLMVRCDDHRFSRLSDIAGDFFLVASHLPFGFHGKFSQDFKFVTVLRDPFQRVLSAYTYGCMRAQSRPCIDGFRAFFREERNRNVAVKQLSGLPAEVQAPRKAVVAAIRNLIEHFYMYGTTADISRICSAILKKNGMPNVWIDNLNRTEPEYRMNGRGFRREVETLNDLDCRLYRIVDGNPRIAELQSRPISPLTVLIREIANDDMSKAEAKCVLTDSIRDVVVSGNFVRPALEAQFTRR